VHVLRRVECPLHSTNNRPDRDEMRVARNAVVTIIRHATMDPVRQGGGMPNAFHPTRLLTGASHYG